MEKPMKVSVVVTLLLIVSLVALVLLVGCASKRTEQERLAPEVEDQLRQKYGVF